MVKSTYTASRMVESLMLLNSGKTGVGPESMRWNNKAKLTQEKAHIVTNAEPSTSDLGNGCSGSVQIVNVVLMATSSLRVSQRRKIGERPCSI